MSAANSKPLFRFRLDPASGVPIYRQLVDQVRGGLAAGTLLRGDQLPTVRQLAVDLEINPNTVVRAYRELELSGLLESQQGSGTFISEQPMANRGAERQRQLQGIVKDAVARAGAVGFAVDDVIAALRTLQERTKKERA